MIKYMFLPLLLSLQVWATTAPMPEHEATALFQKIKKSEYRWVLAQWRNEMQIKTRSRSSRRKSGLNRTHDNNPLRTIPDPQKIITPPVDPITLPDRGY